MAVTRGSDRLVVGTTLINGLRGTAHEEVCVVLIQGGTITVNGHPRRRVKYRDIVPGDTLT